MPARVADAYSAAKALNSKFKLFISFDMTWVLSAPLFLDLTASRSLGCSSQQDISLLQGYITRYAAHPNQFIYNGKPFASTFAGEGCSYGGDFNSAWSAFRNGLDQNVSPYVLPLRCVPQ
jgi:glucan endo-1,3-alpha-glucosidase